MAGKLPLPRTSGGRFRDRLEPHLQALKLLRRACEFEGEGRSAADEVRHQFVTTRSSPRSPNPSESTGRFRNGCKYKRFEAFLNGGCESSRPIGTTRLASSKQDIPG